MAFFSYYFYTALNDRICTEIEKGVERNNPAIITVLTQNLTEGIE